MKGIVENPTSKMIADSISKLIKLTDDAINSKFKPLKLNNDKNWENKTQIQYAMLFAQSISINYALYLKYTDNPDPLFQEIEALKGKTSIEYDDDLLGPIFQQ